MRIKKMGSLVSVLLQIQLLLIPDSVRDSASCF